MFGAGKAPDHPCYDKNGREIADPVVEPERLIREPVEQDGGGKQPVDDSDEGIPDTYRDRLHGRCLNQSFVTRNPVQSQNRALALLTTAPNKLANSSPCGKAVIWPATGWGRARCVRVLNKPAHRR